VKRFGLKEKALAAALLPGESMEDTVREMRGRLEYGEDWTRGPGGTVLYSDDGARKLAAMVKESRAAIVRASAAEKTAAGDLTVTRVYPTNRQFMSARKNDGAMVTVRVRDNGNCWAGMVLKAEHVKAANNMLVDYCGPMPRGRGRW